MNLGCIDLNPWYARCDDVHRPDYLHFDLDPTPGAEFGQVLDTALKVRDAVAGTQDSLVAEDHRFARYPYLRTHRAGSACKSRSGRSRSRWHSSWLNDTPDTITAEYRIAKRPPNHVLVDYNQNAWGRTLASVYSVRPKPGAPVSAPVTWDEVESGIRIEDFRIDNMMQRVEAEGDLFRPLLLKKNMVKLDKVL